MDVRHRQRSRASAKKACRVQPTGSTAPFVGLFGTVFGISETPFIGVAAHKNTALWSLPPVSARGVAATGIWPWQLFGSYFSTSERGFRPHSWPAEAFAMNFAPILTASWIAEPWQVGGDEKSQGGGGRGRRRGRRKPMQRLTSPPRLLT